MRAEIFAALLVVSIALVVVGFIVIWCYYRRLAELETELDYDREEFIHALNRYAAGIVLAVLGAIGAFAWFFLS